MRKHSFSLLAIVTLVLSMSVSASVVGEKSYTDPSYVMYAGYSGAEVTVSGFKVLSEIDYAISDMDATFSAIVIESLDKLKPDKDNLESTYTVIKPEKLAVMQNSNFDRVVAFKS